MDSQELRCCGVINTAGNSIPTQAKFYQALQAIYIPHSTNEHASLPTEFPSTLYKEPASFLGKENGRADLCEIKFSPQDFANEYDPAYLPGAFPSLYPFGVGGLGDPRRPIELKSAERHLRALLLQEHEAFAKHETFIFVVFNILQRRQICLGSRLVSARHVLPAVCDLLRSLNYQTVRDTLKQLSSSAHHLPRSLDPRLNKLMELTAIASTGCRGSEDYMQRRRTEIRALFVRYGGPHFFITVNPDDVRHPLVLSFSPSTVPPQDQQSFLISLPSYGQRYRRLRCRLIARNPVLQARFFDTVFQAVIDHLLGFKSPKAIGILGKVAAYYALVEAQGKGTLHAHTLVWLSDGNVPTFLLWAEC
jgi:Helitron helicase-like domain at N-terminus